jgi:hypothetical protein
MRECGTWRVILQEIYRFGLRRTLRGFRPPEKSGRNDKRYSREE